MPPIRTSDSDASSEGSKKSPRKSGTAKKWSETEEAKFLEAIDVLVKTNLWAMVKQDEQLGQRGANGVRSHWDALFKKLKRG